MLPTFKRNDNSGNAATGASNSQPSNQPVAAQSGGVSVATYAQPTYAAYGQPIPPQGNVYAQPVMYPQGGAYAQNQPVMYAQPVPAGGQPVVIMTQPHTGQPAMAVIGGAQPISTTEARLFITYKLGKIVRIFGIIDIVGVLINILFSNLFYLIILPMPICGMMSGRNFKIGFAYVYAIFLGCEILIRIVVSVLVPENFFWSIIFILITLMILNYVRKYIHALKECSESDLQELTQNYQRFREMDNSCC
mmetsp:Transcript_1083/g.1410  ORF Transcript_1083/g.1410 Transcript_1083/m.1410 type:complete len:249 (-) Transcript_1083:181-927(-)